jgi:hypothetical protein
VNVSLKAISSGAINRVSGVDFMPETSLMVSIVEEPSAEWVPTNGSYFFAAVRNKSFKIMICSGSAELNTTCQKVESNRRDLSQKV